MKSQDLFSPKVASMSFDMTGLDEFWVWNTCSAGKAVPLNPVATCSLVDIRPGSPLSKLLLIYNIHKYQFLNNFFITK